jgi:hypothetical protein
MYYHYETQPLPNALSWYFHWIPEPVHRFSAGYSHFVQVVAPFFLFAPQPIAFVAGVILISQQLILIISGNYSWLNWLTVVLCFSAFDDGILHRLVPLARTQSIGAGLLAGRPLAWEIALWAVGIATLAMSIEPALNLISRDQMMNHSYNRFHLVGAYGAFGNVSRERYEVVIEGTADTVLTAATEWKEYEFKGKPGDIRRRPPQVAPYHLRLDWMAWFLPFGVAVTSQGVRVYGHKLWFLRFIKRLLTNDATILRLLGRNPFPDAPPAHVRAQFYQYRFTSREERKATGAWWSRLLLGTYLAPVNLETVEKV